MDEGHLATAALAGRRIDADNADTKRFPLAAVPQVRATLLRTFTALQLGELVCSAACGADLIGLEVAEVIGIRAHVILPFEPERFKRSSVVDRPGDWGTPFDRALAWATATGTVLVLDLQIDGDAAYRMVTHRLVSLAEEIASGRQPFAISVTETKRAGRQGRDATAEFKRLAMKRGFNTVDVGIL